MSQVDRNRPRRGAASESTYSIMEFLREFPDDKTCLDWLWRNRYSDDGSHAHCPKCVKTRKFHRVASRPSYSCDTCGHHIHPTAGTIFHRSATSLHLWFYAMYLMTSTRCAVSAKHVERELGVTYKTAWRMCNLIRNQLMSQDDEPPLSGDVEADELGFGQVASGLPQRVCVALQPPLRPQEQRQADHRHERPGDVPVAGGPRCGHGPAVVLTAALSQAQRPERRNGRKPLRRGGDVLLWGERVA